MDLNAAWDAVPALMVEYIDERFILVLYFLRGDSA
jgi:hypothetical protein